MNDLYWVQINKNIFYIKDNFGKAIFFSPLQGKLISINNNSQLLIDEIIKTNNNDRQELEKLLEKFGFKFINQPLSPEFKEYKPTRIMLSLSNLCNLNCIYCYAATDKKHILSWDKITKSIDLIINNAINQKIDEIEICFHGTGETLVQRELFIKTINYSLSVLPKNISINYSLVTNATLLNSDIVKVLKKYKFFITVSMDGIKKVQNKQRPYFNGTGSFDDVINGIKMLINEEIPFVIRSTITGENINQMQEFLLLCHSLGCKQVSFMPFSPIGRASEGIKALDVNEFIENYRLAKIQANNYNIDLSMAGTEIDEVNTYYCGAIGNNCLITPDGYISTCSRVTKSDDLFSDLFIIGNVENEGFSINNNKLETLIENNVYSYDQCKDCFAKYICAGGCPHDRLTYKERFELSWCKIVRNLVWDQLIELL